MKRCTISLLEKRHIKTRMWHHLTPPWRRMTIMKKSTNNKCWWCGEKATLLHSWWESMLLQPLWRSAQRLPTKLKTELPYYSAIPTPGHVSRKDEYSNSKKITRTAIVTAPLFTRLKTWKHPRCPPTDEWINKMWRMPTPPTHAHARVLKYYSAMKNNEAMSLEAA